MISQQVAHSTVSCMHLQSLICYRGMRIAHATSQVQTKCTPKYIEAAPSSKHLIAASKDDQALAFARNGHLKAVTLAACNSRGSSHIFTRTYHSTRTQRITYPKPRALHQTAQIPRPQEFLKAGFAGIFHLGSNDFACSDVLCSSPRKMLSAVI